MRRRRHSSLSTLRRQQDLIGRRPWILRSRCVLPWQTCALCEVKRRMQTGHHGFVRWICSSCCLFCAKWFLTFFRKGFTDQKKVSRCLECNWQGRFRFLALFFLDARHVTTMGMLSYYFQLGCAQFKFKPFSPLCIGQFRVVTSKSTEKPLELI